MRIDLAKEMRAAGRTVKNIAAAFGGTDSSLYGKLAPPRPKANKPKPPRAAAPTVIATTTPAPVTADGVAGVTIAPIVADGVTGYTLPAPPANLDGKPIAEALHDITARCSTTPLLETATAGDLRDFIRYKGMERTAETFLGIKQYLEERAG